jgi:hypothetical protein
MRKNVFHRISELNNVNIVQDNLLFFRVKKIFFILSVQDLGESRGGEV